MKRPLRRLACVTSIVTFSSIASAAEEAMPARLLILSKAESKLAIVNPVDFSVIARVPTGNSPHEVCVSADGRTAYVSDYGANVPGNTITVIDIPSAKVTRTIDLGPLRRPHGIAEHGGKIYFTAEFNAAIGRIDLAKGEVDLIIGTGQQGSHMIAVDPADGRLYTTNLFSDSVTAIDPQRGPGGGPLTSHVTVEGQPEGIALSPDGRELWAAPRAGGPIAVIETAGDTVKHQIKFEGAAIRLTFTPDGTRVLASDFKDHELVIFDAKTREEVGTVKVEDVPVGTLVQPDNARAFVACTGAHKVYAIDLKEMKVVGEIEAGAAPDGLAWAAPRAVATPRKPGMFGAKMENVSQADADKFDLGAVRGVLIAEPMPNSPALAAGLKPGDIVLAVNGTPVANVAKFVRMLSRASAGDELKLDVHRDGQTQAITVTLAPRPG